MQNRIYPLKGQGPGPVLCQHTRVTGLSPLRRAARILRGQHEGCVLFVCFLVSALFFGHHIEQFALTAAPFELIWLHFRFYTVLCADPVAPFNHFQ